MQKWPRSPHSSTLRSISASAPLISKSLSVPTHPRLLSVAYSQAVVPGRERVHRLKVRLSAVPLCPSERARPPVWLPARSFARVFVEQQQLAFPTATLDTYRLQVGDNAAQVPAGPITMGSVVLAGVGAVGQAAVWALSQAPLVGELTLVDHELIDLGNLQRYVLAQWDSIKAQKAEFAAQHFAGNLQAVPLAMTWRDFAATSDHRWPLVLVALDSAQARREVQAGLPQAIINAWTQQGDLGVSTHPHLERGACMRCLYFPDGPLPNEDQLIAAALRLPHAQHGLSIRGFLHTGEGLPEDFLQLVAEALGQPFETLAPYVGKPIRTLYEEGVCGGTVLPLDVLGKPADAVQVPIAHQSALAGILLAARATAVRGGLEVPATELARLDVMSSIGSWGQYMSQPRGKNPAHACICKDGDYVAAYHAKYEN